MKKNIVALSAIAVLLLGMFLISSSADSNEMMLMRRWGTVLNDVRENHDTEVYAEGNYVTVLEKDVQKAADFYMMNGISEEEAREKAETYMMEYEAMYNKAIQAGFQVKDDEVKNYIEELKNEVKKADNREEVMAVINQFESEDAYWEYEFEVYRKSLPIQNYVRSLEKSYKEIANSGRSISEEEIEQEWLEEFDMIKQQAVLGEEYSIIK